MSLLRLQGINTHYGQIHILEDMNIQVGETELVSLPTASHSPSARASAWP